MNSRTLSPGTTQPVARFDRKFIEDHQLIERYLEGKLPVKGARDLEQWCRNHPEYLAELHLAERAQSSLKLLEASGRPVDLQEPKTPWWKTVQVLIALGLAAVVSLAAFGVLFGKYRLLKGELEATQLLVKQGPLVQPATMSTIHIAPDHGPGIDKAKISVSRTAPQLMEVHVDLGYTQKLMQFRLVVDKQDQGRALIVNNLLKDSNGELELTLNSTGLSAGRYNVRIEALPARGSPLPVGYLILEVQ
jgi:hypothetical protein